MTNELRIMVKTTNLQIRELTVAQKWKTTQWPTLTTTCLFPFYGVCKRKILIWKRSDSAFLLTNFKQNENRIHLKAPGKFCHLFSKPLSTNRQRGTVLMRWLKNKTLCKCCSFVSENLFRPLSGLYQGIKMMKNVAKQL